MPIMNSLADGTHSLLTLLERFDCDTDERGRPHNVLSIRSNGIALTVRIRHYTPAEGRANATVELSETVPWAELALLDAEGVTKRFTALWRKLVEQSSGVRIDVNRDR